MQDAAARPIHVLSTADTKTLFALLGDRRIRYTATSAPGDPPPDVLAIPMHGSEFPLEGLIPRASPEVWRRIASGETLLVFDNATEGHPYQAQRADAVHAFLAANALPASSVVFVTQDRFHADANAAHAARRGYGATYTTLTYDYFIKNLLAPYETRGAQVFAERLAAFRARAARRPRRFISLNFTPRPIKALFLTRLIEDGLWDKGFISFGGFPPEDTTKATRASIVLRRLRARALTGPLTPGQEAAFEVLAAKPAQYLNGYRKLVAAGKRKTPVLDETLPEHDHSWFTVVTETEMDGSWRVTEKPMKSLLGLHPTVMLANARSLELLRDFGFRTFEGYFDEAYDLEPDPGRRFEMVYAQVARLARADEAELQRLEEAFAETLIHNAEWGLTKLPGVYRDRIDVAFVDRIAALLGR